MTWVAVCLQDPPPGPYSRTLCRRWRVATPRRTLLPDGGFFVNLNIWKDCMFSNCFKFKMLVLRCFFGQNFKVYFGKFLDLASVCGSAVKYTRVCFSKRWRHVNVSAFERFGFKRQRLADFERYGRRRLASTSSILLQTLTSPRRHVDVTLTFLFWKIPPQYCWS